MGDKIRVSMHGGKFNGKLNGEEKTFTLCSRFNGADQFVRCFRLLDVGPRSDVAGLGDKLAILMRGKYHDG
jgi:hypothetical protein